MNIIINQYSKVISTALKNVDFRSLIKQLAIVCTDGDYDILNNVLLNYRLPNSTDSVRTFISNIVNESYIDEFELSGTEFLELVNNTIPNLQISVPVECDEWDPETYTPYVIPLPIDFDEHKNNYITA